MAEAGYTTQTTVTQTSTTVQTNLRYDPTYVRTVPGALKCAQLVSFNRFIIANLILKTYAITFVMHI